MTSRPPQVALHTVETAGGERPGLAITGATGYIGALLMRMAIARGWRVVALSRHPPAIAGVEHVPYDLSTRFATELAPDVRALIHLAADTAGTELDETREIAAASELLDRFAPSAVRRFVFVSSQAAATNAPTRYGRVKAAIEADVLARGGFVVRPGLVYGRTEAGLFGTICALVRRLPVLPALLPPPLVQPIHVDDLCMALLTVAAAPEPRRRRFDLAAEAAVSFTAFVEAVARHRLHRRRLLLPVPIAVTIGLLRLAGRFAPPLAVASERLRSLRALHTMDTTEALADLGIEPRSLARGMSDKPDTPRRRLVTEGATLIGYCLQRPATVTMIGRYVRACEQLGLPAMSPGCPSHRRLRLVDAASATALADALGVDATLPRRLTIATAVAESSPRGADRFLLAEPLSRPTVAARLIGVGLVEGGWVLARTALDRAARVGLLRKRSRG